MIHFDFEINFKEEVVDLIVDETTDPVEVPMENIYKWAVAEGLADYCSDFYEPSSPDRHGQKVGTLGLTEYFNLPYETLKKDLETYYKAKILK